VNVDLLPGDYLVEVVWDDGRFHEVYRRVPEKVEVLSDRNRHRHWSRTPDGRIEFYAVDAPPPDVARNMVLIQGVDPSAAGSDLAANNAHGIEIRERVRSFLIDPTEATVADFKFVKGGAVPIDDRYMPKPDDFPITISYDTAVGLAEQLGKRLPDEMEYELAASYRDPTESTMPGMILNETPGDIPLKPVKHLTLDRLHTQPEVIGLFSNVAEWTMTRDDLATIKFPAVQPYKNVLDMTLYHLHVARGGIFAIENPAAPEPNRDSGTAKGVCSFLDSLSTIRSDCDVFAACVHDSLVLISQCLLDKFAPEKSLFTIAISLCKYGIVVLCLKIAMKAAASRKLRQPSSAGFYASSVESPFEFQSFYKWQRRNRRSVNGYLFLNGRFYEQNEDAGPIFID
jgi:hypothetical protein